MTTFNQGDFHDIQQIGDGGEGTVFRANTKHFGCVAIKVFNRRKGNLREIENMRKFSQHPNIIDFLGTVKIDGYLSPQFGYAMKYMPQGSIHDVIHIKKLEYSIGMIYRWMFQAATAIAYLHENNVIHRDVKPANMLLSDSLRHLYISDFGLAKVCLQNGMTSFQGSTYTYMAPEIFQNLNACNKACDVYSFAISIWEIVTRRFPYEDNPEITDDLSLRAEVLTGTRPSLMVYFDPYSSELLNSSWNSDPTSRPSMETIVAFFDERNPTEPSEQLSNKQMSIKLNEETPKDTQEDLTDGFHMHRKVTGMDGSEYILFFGGCFGNFWSCDKLNIGDCPFVCTEQYYTYTKAAYFNDYETSESIMRATSPHEMKKLGRMITNFNLQKWSKPSLKAMLIANVHKYMQNLNLQKALESTAPLEMVEALPHDKMWGIGRSIDTPQALDRSQWRGKNFLGKMLDAIRSALISKEFETPDQMIDHLCRVFDCEHVNFFSDS